MFYGVWNKARANKDNIIYAIVTIVLLERVRTGWNRMETNGRRQGIGAPRIEAMQRNLVVQAALLYGLLLVLPIVKYIFRSVEELSWTIPGLAVLKSTWAFFVVVVLTECFLAVVIYNLLRVYIDRMNAAVGFFTAIGRNIWDGSKMAVHVGTTVGAGVVGGVRGVVNLTRSGAGAMTGASRNLLKAVGGAGVNAVRRWRRRPPALSEPTDAGAV
jgi:hypothetical protein